jgi:hypothetical protein
MSPDSVFPRLTLLLREAELANDKAIQDIFNCLAVPSLLRTKMAFRYESIDLCFVQQDGNAM